MSGNSVTIKLAVHQWQVCNGATRSGLIPLSDYSESSLAAKIFAEHPDVETVFVDGEGSNKRVIHRNIST